MATYRVPVIDRESGAESTQTVEAFDSEEAVDWCVKKGWIAGTPVLAPAARPAPSLPVVATTAGSGTLDQILVELQLLRNEIAKSSLRRRPTRTIASGVVLAGIVLLFFLFVLWVFGSGLADNARLNNYH